jgi:tetrahydromethanopterin S-methyltransferase subunit B
MTAAVESKSDDALPAEVALAFAPLHKRAFGIAIGLAIGLTVFLLTAVYLLRSPQQGIGLALLSQYFKGYSVSWGGAFVGLFWGFVVGFVGGWFVAFCRNLVIAASIFIIRAKSELHQTRDFLDHI